jgi:hypothetical protein
MGSNLLKNCDESSADFQIVPAPSLITSASFSTTALARLFVSQSICPAIHSMNALPASLRLQSPNNDPDVLDRHLSSSALSLSSTFSMMFWAIPWNMATRSKSTSSMETSRPRSEILVWIDLIAESVSELARLVISAATSTMPELINNCARVAPHGSVAVAEGREPVFIPKPPPLQ